MSYSVNTVKVALTKFILNLILFFLLILFDITHLNFFEVLTQDVVLFTRL